jgi:hypothetical protein
MKATFIAGQRTCNNDAFLLVEVMNYVTKKFETRLYYMLKNIIEFFIWKISRRIHQKSQSTLVQIHRRILRFVLAFSHTHARVDAQIELDKEKELISIIVKNTLLTLLRYSCSFFIYLFSLCIDGLVAHSYHSSFIYSV